MGSRTAPESPSKEKDCNDPVNKTKTDCKDEKKCWVDDYDKKITVNSYGRYFKKYKADGSEYSYTFNKKYKIVVPVKTGDTITVEVRFKPEVQTGVSEERRRKPKPSSKTALILTGTTSSRSKPTTPNAAKNRLRSSTKSSGSIRDRIIRSKFTTLTTAKD